MKYLSLIFAALLIAASAAPAAADVDSMYNANQATIAWDAVADATSYRVYTRPVTGGEPEQIDEITTTAYTLAFDDDASVVVGVRAVRTTQVDGIEEPVEATSAIAWSDMAEHCVDGATFGVYYVRPPGAVAGLQLQ